jgi:RNA polymerase sigma-70 factor (ECF subfamily)
MRDPLALAFSLVADRAWRLAFALTFHAPDAEDLLQQTLLVAARKRSRIPSDDPWPWFAAVMHREVRNLRRKNLRHITSALQEASMADAHHGPADAAARNELRQQLRSALQQLPEDERDALVAGYIGGLTQKQAAKALGLPLGTYKKRVREGLSSLRRRMKVEGAQATALLPLIPIPAPPPGWEAALIQSVSHIAPAGAIVGGIAMKKIAIAAASVLAVAILGTWAAVPVLFPESTEHPHRVDPFKRIRRHARRF